MTIPILTRELWGLYTSAQQQEYRNRLFISRPNDKATTPWLIDGVDVPLDSPEMLHYQQALLTYYRITGFPLYTMGAEEKFKKFKSLYEYPYAGVFKDGLLNQTMHGLGLAWTYFPHMWGIQCNKMKTPLEVFNDDTLFMKAIIKRMRWGTYISDSGIRKALKSFSGTQSVSNFRPSAAAAIYHHFIPAEGGVTWDMSSGFGGRLLGAMACNRVKKYIGTDPSTYTNAN